VSFRRRSALSKLEAGFAYWPRGNFSSPASLNYRRMFVNLNRSFPRIQRATRIDGGHMIETARQWPRPTSRCSVGTMGLVELLDDGRCCICFDLEDTEDSTLDAVSGQLDFSVMVSLHLARSRSGWQKRE